MSQKTLWLMACEPSGDVLGQHIMRMLQNNAAAPYAFHGIGGPLMTQAGLTSLFPYTELSVMGFFEVLPHLRQILQRREQIRCTWRKTPPDLIITIDAPGFNLPLARYARTRGIPVIHAVAPSVWAWKPKRAKIMAGIYDHLWALLPFEPPYFIKEGLPCTFIGHPAALPTDHTLDDVRTLQHTYAIQDVTPVISLWPGSRTQEINRMLPIFIEAFREIYQKRPDVIGLVPAVEHLHALICQKLDPALPLHVVLPQDKHAVMVLSAAALATSGTVTLELACASVPMVVGYTMNALSYALARRLVKSPFISLPNIVSKRPLVPELIQDACIPETLAHELLDLLEPIHPKRRHQIQGLKDIRSIVMPLHPDGSDLRQVVEALLHRA